MHLSEELIFQTSLRSLCSLRTLSVYDCLSLVPLPPMNRASNKKRNDLQEECVVFLCLAVLLQQSGNSKVRLTVCRLQICGTMRFITCARGKPATRYTGA